MHGLPVTVGVALLYPPGGNHQVVNVCFSPTPEGAPGAVAGGLVGLDIWTDTGTVAPGAYVSLYCLPDGGIWCSGAAPTSANVAVSDIGTGAGTCLVSIGTGCLASVPIVVLNGDPGRPLLAIQVAGFPVGVDSPVRCISIGGTC